MTPAARDHIWTLISFGYILSWPINGLIGFFIGRRRGLAQEAALLGAFLGPLGWLPFSFVRDRRKKCPSCGTLAQSSATHCKKCFVSFMF
jgi:hypothetical protein